MAQNDLRIRIATTADLISLAELSRDTFIAAFGPENTRADMDLYVAENLSDKKLLDELNDTANIFLLLYCGEELAGYSKIRPGTEKGYEMEAPALEIARIYVHRNFQNQGLGAVLLKHILDHSRSHNFRTLWLGVWEYNFAAIRFYERWGFTKFGSHKFVLGTDEQTDILMKLPLV